MTAGSRGIISLTEAFPVSAERVFDAWLNPEKVARWFHLDAEEQVMCVEIDARVGGSIRIVTNRAGRAVEHTGQYLEIQRPHRLSFTMNRSAFGKPARVTVLIEPRGAGCFLTLISSIEPAPLRALAPLATLTPFRAKKAALPRWPGLEAKAALYLGIHLAMLPLLPILLREPEPPPAAASPPPLAMLTVGLATAAGVSTFGRSTVPTPIPQPPPADSRPVPHATTSRTTLPPLHAQPVRMSRDQEARNNPPAPRPLNALEGPFHAIIGADPATAKGGPPGEDSEVLHQRAWAANAQPEPPPTICGNQQGSPWVRCTVKPALYWLRE